MPNKMSPDFKTIYANGLGFAVGDNDCRLSFGTSDLLDSNNITEQVAVYMTHKTLKLLAYTAKVFIDHHEKTTGQQIPLDQDKIEQLKRALGQSVSTTTTLSPTT